MSRPALISALLALSGACSNAAPDHPSEGRDASAVIDGGESGAGGGTEGAGAGEDGRDASQGPPLVVMPPGTHDAGHDSLAPGVDAAVPDSGAHDAGFDAGFDAGPPDPPPPTGIAYGHLELLSGAGRGTGSVAGHRLRLSIGLAGVRGAGSSAGYRLRLGSRR